MKWYCGVFLSLSLMPGFVFSQDLMCSIKTPKNKVALIEMYTSEACSSCPPGDRAISVLPNIHFPSDKVAVLAFHVNYWDHLDWIDPFYKKEFVQRHQILANKNKAKALFTPHFFVNSKEVFNWRSNLVKEVDLVGKLNSQISFSVDYEIKDAKLKVKMFDDFKKTNLDIFVAVSENKILRKITDGENKGETINYHHVVRELIKVSDINNTIITLGNDWKIENLSLVVFAQDKNFNVIQSVYDNALKDCVVKK